MSPKTRMPNAVRRLVVPLVRAVRRAYVALRKPALHRQIRALRDQSSDPLSLSQAEQLVAAWGIASGADARLLVEIAHRATISPGPVLECGSGLTTLVAGIYAKHGLWSLEQHDRYRRGVVRSLRKSQIDDATVHLAPLRSYGVFEWYTVPKALPDQFSLVICDGPPSETRGGRSGLIPVMGSRLSAGVVVLLDDAGREGEQAAISLWSQHYGFSLSQPRYPDARYAVLVR